MKLKFFIVIVVLMCGTNGMTPEQQEIIHEQFSKLAMLCISHHPITEEDMTNLRNHQPATGEHVPCFIGCVMKKIGVMDDKGMVQKESFLDLVKTVVSDPEELKNIEDYLHSCSHVNNEPVSDGEKGCERAMLASKCMKENASKFGIEL